MSLVDQEKYIRPSVTRETGYESVYFEVIKTRHIIRNSTPRFTKPDCLVLIRPILNKIQPIKSSKEFETNVELPAIYPLHCILSFYCYMYNFQKFWMAVFCSKSGLIKRKLLNFVKINVHVLTCTYCVHQAKILNSKLWKRQILEFQTNFTNHKPKT